MSHTLKINVTMWAACSAMACTLGGLVWAAAVRGNDLDHVSAGLAQVKLQRDADHESIGAIKADLQTVKALLERIERKLD